MKSIITLLLSLALTTPVLASFISVGGGGGGAEVDPISLHINGSASVGTTDLTCGTLSSSLLDCQEVNVTFPDDTGFYSGHEVNATPAGTSATAWFGYRGNMNAGATASDIGSTGVQGQNISATVSNAQYDALNRKAVFGGQFTGNSLAVDNAATVGVRGDCNNSRICIGASGIANPSGGGSGTAFSIGVEGQIVGMPIGAGDAVAGAFTIANTWTNAQPSQSAVIFGDNTNQAVSLLVLEDNNTVVFEVVDGGDVQANQGVDIGNEFETSSTAVNLTADDTVVNVADTSFLVMSSDSAVAIDRTFTLTAGADGQHLKIVWNSANAGELLDAGIHRLSAAFTPTQDDTLSLISDGTNWYECGRSMN